MKSLSKIVLALYLLFLLWLVLFKFSLNLSSVLDHQTRSLNLIPFAASSSLREIIYNFVVFIPFGLFLSVNLKRATFWQRLALVCIFSLAVEITQFVFAIGATDITDVITNTLGGYLGLLLYDLSNKYVNNEKLDRFIAVAGTLLLIVFILLLGVLLSHGVRYHSPPSKARQALTRYFEF